MASAALALLGVGGSVGAGDTARRELFRDGFESDLAGWEISDPVIAS